MPAKTGTFPALPTLHVAGTVTPTTQRVSERCIATKNTKAWQEHDSRKRHISGVMAGQRVIALDVFQSHA